MSDGYDEHQRHLYYDMVTNVFYETVISDNSREELNTQNSFIIRCKKNPSKKHVGQGIIDCHWHPSRHPSINPIYKIEINTKTKGVPRRF